MKKLNSLEDFINQDDNISDYETALEVQGERAYDYLDNYLEDIEEINEINEKINFVEWITDSVAGGYVYKSFKINGKDAVVGWINSETSDKIELVYSEVEKIDVNKYKIIED